MPKGAAKPANVSSATRESRTTRIFVHFKNLVVQSPDAACITYVNDCSDNYRMLTRQQVWLRACRLAKLLKDQGVKPGSIIGVDSEPRNAEQFIQFLAIDMMNAVYCPLDRSGIELNELKDLAAEAKVEHILTQKSADFVQFQYAVADADADADANTDALLQAVNIIDLNHPNSKAILASSINEGLEPPTIATDGTELTGFADADAIGHIAYSSGRSSRRKIMALPYAGLGYWLEQIPLSMPAMMKRSQQEQINIACTTSLGFDPHLWNYLLALKTGGHLVVMGNDIRNSASLSDAFIKHKISDALMVPTLINLLRLNERMLDLKSNGFRAMHTTGECLKWTIIAACVAAGIDIYNCYGPTESCFGVLVKELRSLSDILSELSGPELLDQREQLEIKARQFHERAMEGPGVAEDEFQQLCAGLNDFFNELSEAVPVGVIQEQSAIDIRLFTFDVDTGQAREAKDEGEVCIAAPHQISAYRNDAAATKESFFEVEEDGVTKLFYRTGDWATLAGDGKLFVHGRVDLELVKIAGKKYDLPKLDGEISVSLPGREVALAKVNITSDTAALVLFHTGKELTAVEKQAIGLNGLLYMPVDKISRTASSAKVDREALAQAYCKQRAHSRSSSSNDDSVNEDPKRNLVRGAVEQAFRDSVPKNEKFNDQNLNDVLCNSLLRIGFFRGLEDARDQFPATDGAINSGMLEFVTPSNEQYTIDAVVNELVTRIYDPLYGSGALQSSPSSSPRLANKRSVKGLIVLIPGIDGIVPKDVFNKYRTRYPDYKVLPLQDPRYYEPNSSTSIDESFLVQKYISQIDTVAAGAPVTLIGHSSGALEANMIHRIQTKLTISQVVLVDGMAPYSDPAMFKTALKALYWRLIERNPILKCRNSEAVETFFKNTDDLFGLFSLFDTEVNRDGNSQYKYFDCSGIAILKKTLEIIKDRLDKRIRYALAMPDKKDQLSHADTSIFISEETRDLGADADLGWRFMLADDKHNHVHTIEGTDHFNILTCKELFAFLDQKLDIDRHARLDAVPVLHLAPNQADDNGSPRSQASSADTSARSAHRTWWQRITSCFPCCADPLSGDSHLDGSNSAHKMRMG